VLLGLDFTGLVAHWGYLAVFVMVAVESLGIPLPGETALILAAGFAGAGATAGGGPHLAIAGVIVAGVAGAIIGDNIGYAIGWWGGYRLLVRYGRYVHLEQSKVKVARYVFRRHGGKVVFFGRWVSILRTYAAFLAGTSRMRWPEFVLYNAAGGALWVTAWSLAAWALGTQLSHFSTPADIGFGIAGAIAVVSVILLVRRQARRLEAVAEREFPGPLEGYEGGAPL
jgi:membrane protein DedA with SNARE-associated domain